MDVWSFSILSASKVFKNRIKGKSTPLCPKKVFAAYFGLEKIVPRRSTERPLFTRVFSSFGIVTKGRGTRRHTAANKSTLK